MERVCRECGIVIHKIAKRLCKDCRSERRCVYLPTPEQIALEAARIKAENLERDRDRDQSSPRVYRVSEFGSSELEE